MSQKNSRRPSLVYKSTSSAFDLGSHLEFEESVNYLNSTPPPRSNSMPRLITELKKKFREGRAGSPNLFQRRPSLRQVIPRCQAYEDSSEKKDLLSECCSRPPWLADISAKIASKETNLTLDTRKPPIVMKKKTVSGVPGSEKKKKYEVKLSNTFAPSSYISKVNLHELLNQQIQYPVYFDATRIKAIGVLENSNQGKSILRRSKFSLNFTTNSLESNSPFNTQRLSNQESSGRDKKVRFCKNIIVNVYNTGTRLVLD